MYPRYAADSARMILADTPVIGLIGPRQSGKMTLAQQLEPKRRYITLDNPNTLAAALADPVGTIRGLDTAISVEIQRARFDACDQAISGCRPVTGAVSDHGLGKPRHRAWHSGLDGRTHRKFATAPLESRRTCKPRASAFP